MKKLNIGKWATAIACVCGLALASEVNALSTLSPEYVGLINPNQPSSPAQEVSYINALAGLAPGGSTSVGGNTITRDGNWLGALPIANLTGAQKDDSPSTTVDVTGYEYLLGKYDAANAGALVFYVGNLTGNQTIPANFSGHGLSHWSLFNATPREPGDNLPDGGATVALLGLGLAALGASRRFIKR